MWLQHKCYLDFFPTSLFCAQNSSLLHNINALLHQHQIKIKAAVQISDIQSRFPKLYVFSCSSLIEHTVVFTLSCSSSLSVLISYLMTVWNTSQTGTSVSWSTPGRLQSEPTSHTHTHTSTESQSGSLVFSICCCQDGHVMITMVVATDRVCVSVCVC